MPKQRITFQRTETVTMEFDYTVDPATKGTVEYWANYGFCGVSLIGRLGTGTIASLVTTDWKLIKSEPPVTPRPDAAPVKKTVRKRKV